jgi:hypothetical protein
MLGPDLEQGLGVLQENFVLLKEKSQLYFQQLLVTIFWMNRAYFLPRTQRQCPRKTCNNASLI